MSNLCNMLHELDLSNVLLELVGSGVLTFWSEFGRIGVQPLLHFDP
jgi:hypothetical protein